MSITTSGFGSSSPAWTSPSAMTRRPSASVLSTSTVLPPLMRRTSPGRVADPDGMFSARHSSPVTATGSSSWAAARTTASTVAAPPMSTFIHSMAFGGLSDRPPESNVMPLPTMATWRVAPSGR